MDKGKALWKTGLLLDNVPYSNCILFRWFISSGFPPYDTQQDLTQISTSLSNGVLTASFTRPIVSSDKTQDLDLDVCQYYILWTYGGTVTNFTSPVTLNPSTQIFGVFDTKICLPDNCQGYF